jgi:CheY-like chemotaxis protein
MKTSGKTILLLTSDPVVRSVIRDVLEHGGYSVVAVGDLGFRC